MIHDCMTFNPCSSHHTLLQSISEGFLTEDDVDAALYNLLLMRFKMGLFDPIADQPYWNILPDVVNTDASRNLSLLSSQQVLVS